MLTWSIYRTRDPRAAQGAARQRRPGLLVLWVGALQIMIDKGKELDWFASGQIVMLAVVAVVGFAFFLAWELTEHHPRSSTCACSRGATSRSAPACWRGGLRPVLRQRGAAAAVAAAVHGLHRHLGRPGDGAGGLFAILLSPLVGKNVARVDPRKLATVAFVVFALVLWMRSQFNPQSTFSTVLLPTLVQGVAMAFFFIRCRPSCSAA